MAMSRPVLRMAANPVRRLVERPTMGDRTVCSSSSGSGTGAAGERGSREEQRGTGSTGGARVPLRMALQVRGYPRASAEPGSEARLIAHFHVAAFEFELGNSLFT